MNHLDDMLVEAGDPELIAWWENSGRNFWIAVWRREYRDDRKAGFSHETGHSWCELGGEA